MNAFISPRLTFTNFRNRGWVGRMSTPPFFSSFVGHSICLFHPQACPQYLCQTAARIWHMVTCHVREWAQLSP